MKSLKDRDKCVKLLQKELKKIHSRSTLLNIRRSVRKASTLFNEVIDFIERYDPDLLSIQAVKVKNAYLARALQKERERSSILLQEKNQLQAAFHEIRCEKIELKREKVNLERMLLSDLEDFKSTLPNIVEISELYSRKIMKYDALKKNITCGRFSNISFGNNCSTPPVSTVNPMIKGCVIQKPTINVRRVPLPNELRSSMFEYVNVGSPITEDNEEISSPANNLTRRCENGLRGVLNISNRRRAERVQQSVSATDANFCNNVADDEQPNVHLEPVVRLEDVTRLLQHSSIRISETPAASPADEVRARESTNEHWSPEVLVPKISTPIQPNLDLSDNPLEGCSWMYQRSSPSAYDDKRPSTSYGYQNRSFKSPLFPRSPCCVARDSSGPKQSTRIDSVPTAEFTSISSNNDDEVVVSSSNVVADEEVLPVGITRRKRKRSLGSRSRSRSIETNESAVQNDVELNHEKRTHHLRRSTRLSCRMGDISDTGSAETLTRMSKVGIANETAGTRNRTLNDSDISVSKPRRNALKSRKDSKTNVSVLSVSNSDSDDSSLQSRPRRNRGVINLKEPSLHTKLRRN